MINCKILKGSDVKVINSELSDSDHKLFRLINELEKRSTKEDDLFDLKNDALSALASIRSIKMILK